MTHYPKVFIRAADTGRFLFQLRDNKSGIANPGLWTLVGGATEEGEEIEDAALREVEEETGLRISHVKQLGVTNVEVHYSDGRKTACDLHIFISTIEKEVKPRLGEGKELRWMSLEEFLQLPIIPGLEAFTRKHLSELTQ